MNKESAPRSSYPHDLDSEDPNKHDAMKDYYKNFDKEYVKTKAEKREAYYNHLVSRKDSDTGKGLTDEEIAAQLKKFDDRYDDLYGRNTPYSRDKLGDNFKPNPHNDSSSNNSPDDSSNASPDSAPGEAPDDTEGSENGFTGNTDDTHPEYDGPVKPSEAMVPYNPGRDDSNKDPNVHPEYDGPVKPEEAMVPYEPKENLDMRAVYVDLSHDAEKHAHYLAQKRWEAETHETKNVFKRMGAKMMADYKKNKYYREFYDAIIEQRTLMVDYSDADGYKKNNAAADRLKQSLVEKYINDYKYEIENDDANKGEYRESLADENSQPYRIAYDMIRQYASSNGSNDERRTAFASRLSELQEAINEYYADKGRAEAKGDVSVDNLLRIANNARTMAEYGKDMAEVMAKFELVLGENRTTARTAEHYNAVDKATHKWTELKQRIPGLKVIPDELIAAGASIGIWAGTKGLSTFGRAAGLFGGAAAIGVTSGVKESYKIVRQRALYDIDTAYGHNYGPEDRRERGDKYQEFQVERNSAESLTNNLTRSTENILRLRASGELSQKQLNDYIDLLAHSVAAKQFSVEEGVDKISYSSADLSVVTAERNALAIAQAEAKDAIDCILRNSERYESISLDDTLQLDTLIEANKEVFRLGTYTDEMGSIEKEAAFKGYKRLESIKTGLKAAGVSLLAGLSLQEALAYVNPNTTGFFEGKTGGFRADNADSTNTLLRNIFGGPDARIRNISASVNEIVSNPGEGLTETQRQQLEALKDQGFDIKESSYNVTNSKSVMQSLQEFQANNPNEFESLSTTYFNNDTSSIFDLNEQGGMLQRLANGNVRFSSDMTVDGSFVGGASIDMTQASNTVFTLELMGPDGLESGVQKVFRFGEEVGPPWSEMLYEKSPGVWNVKGDAIGHWGILNGNGGIDVAASIPGDGSDAPLNFIEEITEKVTRFNIADKRVSAEVDWPFAFGWKHGKELGIPVEGEKNKESEPRPIGAERINPAKKTKAAERRKELDHGNDPKLLTDYQEGEQNKNPLVEIEQNPEASLDARGESGMSPSNELSEKDKKRFDQYVNRFERYVSYMRNSFDNVNEIMDIMGDKFMNNDAIERASDDPMGFSIVLTDIGKQRLMNVLRRGEDDFTDKNILKEVLGNADEDEDSVNPAEDDDKGNDVVADEEADKDSDVIIAENADKYMKQAEKTLTQLYNKSSEDRNKVLFITRPDREGVDMVRFSEVLGGAKKLELTDSGKQALRNLIETEGITDFSNEDNLRKLFGTQEQQEAPSSDGENQNN